MTAAASTSARAMYWYEISIPIRFMPLVSEIITKDGRRIAVEPAALSERTEAIEHLLQQRGVLYDARGSIGPSLHMPVAVS